MTKLQATLSHWWKKREINRNEEHKEEEEEEKQSYLRWRRRENNRNEAEEGRREKMEREGGEKKIEIYHFHINHNAPCLFPPNFA